MLPRVFPDLPPRTTCIVRNSLLPLRNHDVSEHFDSKCQNKSSRRSHEKRRLAFEAKLHARDEVQLACVLDATPERPVYEVPRAYFDESRMYLTCDSPQSGDEDHVSAEAHALSALSSDDSSKSSKSFLAGASDRPDPFLQEPRKPTGFSLRLSALS